MSQPDKVNFEINQESSWRKVYLTGAVFTTMVLIGIVIDVVLGNIQGGNLTELPGTAIEKFNELNTNLWIGLYSLDLLNLINQVLLIPFYIALFAVHRNVNLPFALLALIIFLLGTTLFVANNSALAMLDMSNKYFATTDESHKALYAAAGELLLNNGSHGSLNVFPGFILPNIAGLIISYVMLKGKIFSRVTSYAGITGSFLMVIYLVLVTFTPQVKSMATAFAMPGGLLLMLWMILATVKLFKLSKL